MELELRVKECIISRLNLEVTPDEIVNDAALFGDGLGLDSIDAMEMAIALSREFGVTIGDEQLEAGIFKSIDSICQFLRSQLGDAVAAK